MASPPVNSRCPSCTVSIFTPRRKVTRCTAAGATSNPAVTTDSSSVTTYVQRWNSSMSANRGWKVSVSRNANRICTPVCATRSSCSSSDMFRSARSSGPSGRCSPVSTLPASGPSM